MRNKLVLIGVLAVALLVCVVAILAMRYHEERDRQISSLKSDLDNLQRAHAKLLSYNRQLRSEGVAFGKDNGKARAAGQQRHDHAVNDPNGDLSYNLGRADTEKAAVEQMRDLVADASALLRDKYDLYANVYGEDSASKYQDCSTAWAEAATNSMNAWASAINAIDDVLRVEINGGSGSADIDARSGASYDEQSRQEAVMVRLAPKCAALEKSLRTRLENDIATKRRLLSIL